MAVEIEVLKRMATDLLSLGKTEAELRQWICQELGCGTTPSAPTGTGAPPLIVQGTVANDAFTFVAQVGLPDDQNPADSVTFQLDTGAFEMLLTSAIADALKLPHDGPLDISGVTGDSPAYRSHVSIAVMGTNGEPQGWLSVPCVVDPSFTGTPLFGLRFFIDQQVQLTLNPVDARMTWTSL